MKEPAKEETHIESQLLYLFDKTYGGEVNKKIMLVKEFIDIGEWALAADTMAFEYLPGKRVLPETIFNIFIDLDRCMNLRDERRYPSITTLVSEKRP